MKQNYARRAALRNHRRNKIKPLQPLLNIEIGFQDRVQISKREYFELLNENYALKEYKKDHEYFKAKLSNLFRTDYEVLKKAHDIQVSEMRRPQKFETVIRVEFTIIDYNNTYHIK